MLGFLAAVKDKATTVLASTSLGKNYGIKPELKAKIGHGHKLIKMAEKEIKHIKSIKKVPALKSAVKDLSAQGHTLIKELLKEDNLDKITDIIGNHIHKYESIDTFKKHVMEKPSVHQMQQFALTLIDIENYQNLAKKMSQLQKFDSLPLAEQKTLFESLQDGQLISDIISENSKLDIDTIERDIKKMCKALCSELELTSAETKSLIDIFTKLTTNHLTALNDIRQRFVEHFPALIESEKQRIQKAHPEILALETTKLTAVVLSYDSKVKPKPEAESESEPKAETQPSEKQALKK